ncbi:EF-hand domain-containing protein [Streptomyces sp. NPDC057381]|uniref:EF-hand domain-containing protein n=1 Tax=Streptomyces sp. NPDC057381 TaxID=3346111 RepID=UPI003638F9E5
MTTDLVTANLAALYDTFDSTRTGYVDADIFKMRADHVCAGLVPDSFSPERQAIRDVFAAWWNHTSAADHDGDGRVSRDEFIAAHRSKRAAGIVLALANALFDAVDTDQNDEISQEAFTGFYQVCRITDEATRTAFEKLDVNGDGVITREAYLDAVRQFMTSNDPLAPGTWLLGRTGAR